MYLYHLIDTETGTIVATAATEALALAETPYLPSDCVPDAKAWEDVLAVAAVHADGLMGVVDGYRVERVAATTADLRAAARDAEGARSWSLAGELYRGAVAVYPPQAAKGPLGQRDIANLTAQAQSCERTAARTAPAAE